MSKAQKQSPWPPPSRRWFLQAIGIAAVAVAVPKVKPAPLPPTKWIGHF